MVSGSARAQNEHSSRHAGAGLDDERAEEEVEREEDEDKEEEAGTRSNTSSRAAERKAAAEDKEEEDDDNAAREEEEEGVRVGEVVGDGGRMRGVTGDADEAVEGARVSSHPHKANANSRYEHMHTNERIATVSPKKICNFAKETSRCNSFWLCGVNEHGARTNREVLHEM